MSMPDFTAGAGGGVPPQDAEGSLLSNMKPSAPAQPSQSSGRSDNFMQGASSGSGEAGAAEGADAGGGVEELAMLAL